jgi:hypothetical protein
LDGPGWRGWPYARADKFRLLDRSGYQMTQSR